MSRHENEDIKNATVKIREELPMEKPFESYSVKYNINGKKVEGKDIVCAKTSRTSNEGSIPRYYARCNSGELFNPEKNDFSYKKRHWKLRSVNHELFNLYLSFLQNRRLTLLHNAERLL